MAIRYSFVTVQSPHVSVHRCSFADMTTNWPQSLLSYTTGVHLILNDCTVLGESRWGNEVLQIVHTPDMDHGGYRYAVRWNYTTEIRCNTEASAWHLFEKIMAWPDGFTWMFTTN